MPISIFGTKGFSPKKSTPRKAASLSNLRTLDSSELEKEFGKEIKPASLNLNGTELKFEDGIWQADTVVGGVSHKEMMKLKKENSKIKEENNMLKLKIELLMDMLSETTVECHILQKERDFARKSLRRT